MQALLEERRAARADLQPLLRQLSATAAATLSSGSAALLSELRAECVRRGGAEVQASTQRYLLALLSAAHQHNVGAARSAPEGSDGGGGGTVAALAAALGGRQVVLQGVRGSSDVSVVAG